jgi:Acetyltransferase (GNAT) domain
VTATLTSVVAAPAPAGIDADPEFLHVISSVRPEVISPYTATLTDGDDQGSPAAMAVGRLETYALPCRIGYQRLPSPRLRTITIVDGGMIGDLDGGRAERLVRDLVAAVDRGDAEALAFHKLRIGSPAHDAVLCVGARLPRRRIRVDVPRSRWLLELPDTLAGYRSSRSRSTRESLKRYEKKFERDFAGRFELRRFDQPADLETILADMEPVAAKTYQRSLGVGFADNDEFRALIGLGLDRGWFCAWVLYIDGGPVAFWFGFGYRGVFLIGSPGYDPALGDYRIGNYVHLRMVDDLCQDPTISHVDYGSGDAEYKRRFGTTSHEEQDVLVFGPGMRAITARLELDAAAGLNRMARKVVGGRLADTIRKRWRQRSAGDSHAGAR